MKVRNPWGEKEWTGGGSDSDKKFWNSVSPAEKRLLGYSEKNDGVFFMFWEDFLEYFQVINICKVDDKANYYYEELNYPKDVPVFTALTTRGGNITLAVTQLDTRNIPEVPAPRYATVVMIVARRLGGRGKEDY